MIHGLFVLGICKVGLYLLGLESRFVALEDFHAPTKALWYVLAQGLHLYGIINNFNHLLGLVLH